MSLLKRVRTAGFVALIAVPLLGVTGGPAAAATSRPGSALAAAVAGGPDCVASARFKAARFPKSPRVTNKLFPLRPGTNFVMRGTVVEEGVTHRHEILTTVTDLTKVIDGVRTLVVLDRDYDDGQLQESELAFMAQDANGRVWNVGEYPEQYTDGHLDGAPSTWMSGLDLAKAGVGMQPHARLGSAAYLQGVAPKVQFRDCAKVVATGRRVCVPVGCFDNVVVTDEWAPLEPEGGHQRKYYAPGIGNIRVSAVGGVNPEVLQLVERTKLSPKAFAAVRNIAVKQDRRGYRVSPKVYGRTPPVQRLECGDDRS